MLYERNWTMLVHEQLRRFEGSIVAATRPGVAVANAGAAAGGGGGGSASALGHFGYDAADSHSWTFSEALLYSVTVITTIGKWLAPTHRYLFIQLSCLAWLVAWGFNNCQYLLWLAVYAQLALPKYLHMPSGSSMRFKESSIRNEEGMELKFEEFPTK